MSEPKNGNKMPTYDPAPWIETHDSLVEFCKLADENKSTKIPKAAAVAFMLVQIVAKVTMGKTTLGDNINLKGTSLFYDVFVNTANNLLQNALYFTDEQVNGIIRNMLGFLDSHYGK